jgi:hypothetical protein
MVLAGGPPCDPPSTLTSSAYSSLSPSISPASSLAWTRSAPRGRTLHSRGVILIFILGISRVLVPDEIPEDMFIGRASAGFNVGHL